MVGEPVQEGSSETFGAEHLGPFGKREITGDHRTHLCNHF